MSVQDIEPTGGEFVTVDPQQAEHVIQESYQVTGGVRISGHHDGFRFAQRTLSGHAVAVTRFQCTATISYHGPLGGLLCVEQIHRGHLSVETAHEQVQAQAGDTCLIPPHEPWQATSEDIDLAPLILDRAQVASHAAVISGIEPEALEFTGLIPLSAGAVRYWNAAVAHVRRDILSVPAIAEEPLLRAEAFRILATGILTMFPNTALDALTDPRSARALNSTPSVIRRAVEFIDSHAHLPIGLAQIAEAAGVGPRALQHAFRSHHDCTPTAYLRQIRLRRAHRSLREADPTSGDTVATIAAHWGFTHASRFAERYREVYGCSPNETLRR